MTNQSRRINWLLGIAGTSLAAGAAWLTPAPWNWIPIAAVTSLSLRDQVVQRTALKRYQGRGAERRLIIGLFAVVLLTSLGVRRIGDTLQAPATWPALLHSATGCGTERRCYLEVEGHEAGNGRPRSGKFQITGLRDGGLALEGAVGHWWAHPDAGRDARFPQLVPETFHLTFGDRIHTRILTPAVDGLTLGEVGEGLLSAAGNAPDPTTLSPDFGWQSNDIRICGDCVLLQPPPCGFKLHSTCLHITGAHITFDYATIFDLISSDLDATIQQGSLRIIWPKAIPEPDLKAHQLLDRMMS
jgi:hypothetical protein